MRTPVVFSTLLIGLLTVGGAIALADREDGSQQPAPKTMFILDDCDPSAAGGWGPGGCLRGKGRVSRAEFTAYLSSPLSLSVVGHPAWEFGPNYFKIRAGEALRIENVGGRAHTFTKVADYGAGTVPPLSQGLTLAPECTSATTVTPGGGSETISGLPAGDHKFQCCFHAWMRAQVRVFP